MSLQFFDFKEQNIEKLCITAKEYAVYKGLLIRTTDLKYIPMQFCLTPSPISAQYFDFINGLQKEFNYVLHKIAHSPKFLASCFNSMKSVDEFTANLWKIYDCVQKEGIAQPLSFCILRCDYMLHCDTQGDIVGIKQVENNTIAVAMQCLSPLVQDLHAFVLDQLGMRDQIIKIPKNSSKFNAAKSMVQAWKFYGNEKAAILFIVENHSMSNIIDQRSLEFQIWEINSGVKVLRHTFNELQSNVVIRDQKLFVCGSEIAIVYYRWGYAPHHYEKADWDLRLLIERTKAIKCPSIGYHLAGSKRVQQQLTLPNVLEQFLPAGSSAEILSRVFAKQYLLSMDKDGENIISLAISKPDDFVLKPDREGGGNNLFGNEMVEKLKNIGQQNSCETYILMEKIRPPVHSTYIIRSNEETKITNVTSEIGIYGVVIGTEDYLHQNSEIGYNVKSKDCGMNEGGLCAGYGYFDSPLLY